MRIRKEDESFPTSSTVFLDLTFYRRFASPAISAELSAGGSHRNYRTLSGPNVQYCQLFPWGSLVHQPRREAVGSRTGYKGRVPSFRCLFFSKFGGVFSRSFICPKTRSIPVLVFYGTARHGFKDDSDYLRTTGKCGESRIINSRPLGTPVSAPLLTFFGLNRNTAIHSLASSYLVGLSEKSMESGHSSRHVTAESHNLTTRNIQKAED